MGPFGGRSDCSQDGGEREGKAGENDTVCARACAHAFVCVMAHICSCFACRCKCAWTNAGARTQTRSSSQIQNLDPVQDSTADVATRTPSAGSSSSATAARAEGGASESTLPAMEAKGEEKVTKESFKPVSFNVEEAEKPAAAAAPAKSSPFGDKVSLKRQWRDESGVMAWC